MVAKRALPVKPHQIPIHVCEIKPDWPGREDGLDVLACRCPHPLGEFGHDAEPGITKGGKHHA